MPEPLADLLATHMQALNINAAEPEALLFPSWDGGLLRYSNWLQRSWWPALVASGAARWVTDSGAPWKSAEDGKRHYSGPGFHDLRRTSTTALVVDGVDIKTAQYRLGHSSAALTLEVDAQAEPQAERGAADAIGARLMTG